MTVAHLSALLFYVCRIYLWPTKVRTSVQVQSVSLNFIVLLVQTVFGGKCLPLLSSYTYDLT